MQQNVKSKQIQFSILSKYAIGWLIIFSIYIIYNVKIAMRHGFLPFVC